MEQETKKKEVTVTRAEKKDATKQLIKDVLTKKEYKHNDLIDEAARLYVERFGGETDNINDVKGRIGSVLDIMKKEQDVEFEGGMYALTVQKAEVKQEASSDKANKKTTRKTKKAEEGTVKEEEPKKEKKAVKTKKTVAKEKTPEEEKTEPLPVAPLQPIAPVAPITPEVSPEVAPQEKKERKQPKKATKKAKEEKQETVVIQSKTTEEKAETETPVLEAVKEEKVQENTALTTKEKGELAPKATVMDMSFLFGTPKAAKTDKAEKVEKVEKTEVKPELKAEEKPVKKEEKEVSKAKPIKEEKAKAAPKKQEKTDVQQQNKRRAVERVTTKAMTADEKLREAFLKRIRSLGGDYFEYYSVYLLEKYSRRNGRRLESLKITAGDHDGGIDGEIELTDKLGFKETIYIQSKNWNPEKGDEKLWVVGETLLQQFIGACACRQAKDGKQNCRGIFITTSRFTPEAKRILDDMSDKLVGYDGEDLYEAAKESEFGVIKKNGEWVLDEGLLSGEKAFFNML